RLVFMNGHRWHRRMPQLRYPFHLLLQIAGLRLVALAGALHSDRAAGVGDVNALAHRRFYCVQLQRSVMSWMTRVPVTGVVNGSMPLPPLLQKGESSKRVTSMFFHSVGAPHSFFHSS